MIGEKINTHPGYVILCDVLGSDLTPVDSARASFRKSASSFGSAEERLLGYLVREKHFSVFRHAVLTFEIGAPLMVARQLQRYITGAAHDEFYAINEASYRYITSELEFYVPQPDEWRGAPEHKKQGSRGFVPADVGAFATAALQEIVDRGLALYEALLEKGVAPEQARLVLPAYGLMVTWRMTISLQGLFHLLQERLDDHAMYETRQIAAGLYSLAKEHFPRSFAQMLPENPVK